MGWMCAGVASLSDAGYVVRRKSQPRHRCLELLRVVRISLVRGRRLREVVDAHRYERTVLQRDLDLFRSIGLQARRAIELGEIVGHEGVDHTPGDAAWRRHQ